MNNYSIIQKAKPGELKAWSNLSDLARSSVFPLFEIATPKDSWLQGKVARQSGDGTALSIERSLIGIKAALGGITSPFSLDFSSWRSNEQTKQGESVVSFAYQRAISMGLDPILCVNYGAWIDPIYSEACESLAMPASIIRLENSALQDSRESGLVLDSVTEIVETLGLPTNGANVLVDFGSVANLDQAAALERCVSLTEELNNISVSRFVVAGTSIPRSVTGVAQEGGHAKIRRKEYALWLQLRATQPEANWGFSDYGVRPTATSADQIAPHANAKIYYSGKNNVHLFRGKSQQKESKNIQFPKLAREVIGRNLYEGSNYSFGDKSIGEAAKSATYNGSLMEWIAITQNHHATLVTEQVEEVIAVEAALRRINAAH